MHAACLHVHRCGPFFGLLAAGYAGWHRDGAIGMMAELGRGLYTDKIRGRGGKWRPFEGDLFWPLHGFTCIVSDRSLGCWQLVGLGGIATAQLS